MDPTLEWAKNVSAAFLLILFCIGESGGGAFMDRSTKTGSMSGEGSIAGRQTGKTSGAKNKTAVAG